MAYNKDEVKDLIEIDDVYNLLEFFSAEPDLCGDYIISRTICHNGIGEGSKKLFYYNSTKLFVCYTHCDESFDIFGLVQKVRNVDLNTAVEFIADFFNLQNQLSSPNYKKTFNDDFNIIAKWNEAENLEDPSLETIELPEYDIDIIKYYPQPHIKQWEDIGISKEVCDFMDIHYDPINNNILIPHFDANGRCIGIRQRTCTKELEQYGKYKPWFNGQTLYRHPLGFNLYGLNKSQERIKQLKTVIVGESEKDVLSFQSYFGTSNNICVAICGSSISKYQFKLLKDLDIQEMVIAFDHDCYDSNDENGKETQQKIAKVAKKFVKDVKVSVIWDKENILGYKSSPLDEGADKFMYLFKNRIIL